MLVVSWLHSTIRLLVSLLIVLFFFRFITPLRLKLVYIICKDSVPALQRTLRASISKSKCWMLCSEILVAYSKKHGTCKFTVSTKCRAFSIELGVIHSDDWVLKSYLVSLQEY
jgi:hypothetical protein